MFYLISKFELEDKKKSNIKTVNNRLMWDNR